MSNKLIDSIVSISGNNPNQFGTGFAIFKDQDGVYFVTCTHVVEAVGGPQQLKVNGKPAIVIVSDAVNSFDLTVLFVREHLSIPILKLRLTGEIGSTFTTSSYVKSGESRLIKSWDGILDEQVAIQSDSRNAHASAWKLWFKDDRKPEPGCSGAPIIDDQGAVVGMLSHLSTKGNQGLGISLSALRSIWANMPVGLFTDSQAKLFRVQHQVDRESLMNFENELSVFNQVISDQNNRTHLITIQGASGMGKTRLLQEYRYIALENNLHELFIPLGQQISIDSFLEEIVYRLNLDSFNSFNDLQKSRHSGFFSLSTQKAWYRELTQAFFIDLERYSDLPLLVILLDQYERSDRLFREWLHQLFLPHITEHPLITVIAGRDEIEQIPNYIVPRYHFVLNGVTVDWYYRYAQQQKVKIDTNSINLIHKILNGSPKQFVEFVQAQQYQKAN